MTLNTSRLELIYRACTSNQRMKFKVPSFPNSKDMIEEKFKKGSRDPDHAHWGAVLPRSTRYILSAQNLATLDSAVR